MREIPKEQIHERIRFENPWWKYGVDRNPHANLKPRAYFKLFYSLATKTSPNRALLLMGPRRIGKTVFLYQTILQRINEGMPQNSLVYFDLQSPVYNGRGLEELLKLACEASGGDISTPLVVCFDEVQYLRQWELHLKVLVDSYPHIKFIASGSAAAALRLKSNESGAGRFTDFLLPPLTFYEYLDLLNAANLVERKDDNTYIATDLEELNRRFVHYLNFGGYPEVLFSEEIQSDPGRYIRSDIVDKVLLKDLPSLYGIDDIQELNSLFATLAFNTANEVSLEGLSQNSGVAKNTLKRYIEYLESAFLIKVVHRVDCNAKRFRRANFFKVYLTNPSMRSALFAPVTEDSEEMGDLVETAIFSQWFHSNTKLYYARWPDGEVDIVNLDPQDQKPVWAIEVKWSDAFAKQPAKLKHLISFCSAHKCKAMSTTRSMTARKRTKGVPITFDPSSLYCYYLGYNIVRHKTFFMSPRMTAPPTIPEEEEEEEDT